MKKSSAIQAKTLPQGSHCPAEHRQGLPSLPLQENGGFPSFWTPWSEGAPRSPPPPRPLQRSSQLCLCHLRGTPALPSTAVGQAGFGRALSSSLCFP